jgi:hypothetical protein
MDSAANWDAFERHTIATFNGDFFAARDSIANAHSLSR